jgi:hypothetical protein
LIAQNDRLNALNATKKTLAFSKVSFLKKSRTTAQNAPKMGILEKNWHFWRLFSIFSETVLCKELNCFAFRSGHHNGNLEL